MVRLQLERSPQSHHLLAVLHPRTWHLHALEVLYVFDGQSDPVAVAVGQAVSVLEHDHHFGGDYCGVAGSGLWEIQ